MKKIFLSLLLLIIIGEVSIAQCGKKTMLSSSKTEYLDAAGNAERTVDEKSTLEFDKSSLLITTANGDVKMNGIIKSDTCNWKTPFKEGISIIKTALTRDGGETMDATITIEGKNGIIILLFETEQSPNRKIKIVADKFDEKI